MKFIINNESVPNLFQNSDVIVKVLQQQANDPKSETKEIHIVRSADYERALYNRAYNACLYLLPLPQRMAYLFGCTNVNFREKSKYRYLFYFKPVKDVDVPENWSLWFSVEPYQDSVYGIELNCNGVKMLT